MAKEHPTLRLPPTENWNNQDLAYGFYVERPSRPYSHANYKRAGGANIVFADPEDIHLLNLNPQSITVSEPVATSVTFTQGGGKFIESRGGILKNFSIRGTTGLQPPIRPGTGRVPRPKVDGFGLLPRAPLVDEQVRLTQMETSGFMEFYKLRKLFRQFMLERKQGKNVVMHWLDFKGDEFWLVEPSSFDLERSMQSRLTYRYSITFQGIEPSEEPNLALEDPRALIVRGGVPAIKGRPDPANGFGYYKDVTFLDPKAIDTIQRRAKGRLKQMRRNGLRSLYLLPGVVRIKMQQLLDKIGVVQQFAADLAWARRTVLDTGLQLYRQLLSATIGLSDAIYDNSPAAIQRDLNEFCLEVRFLTEGLIAYTQQQWATRPGEILARSNDKFTKPKARLGSRGDLVSEENTSTGSPTVNPFIGKAGFQLIGDVEAMARLTELRPEDIIPGENIFDVAMRLLGDVHKFVDLVILNNLSPPYIVEDQNDKPANTLAWGESILVPVIGDQFSLASALPVDASVPASEGTISSVGTSTQLIDADIPDPPGQWRVNQWEGFTVEIRDGLGVGQTRIIITNTEDTLTVNRAWDTTPAAGDVYRIYLKLFSRRRVPTPESRAFGRDILAVFTKEDGVIKVDTMLGPQNDLATVEGEENFKQAMLLFMHCEQGSNYVHPRYGLAPVTGAIMKPSTVALHTFLARQQLYADPRVHSVVNPRFSFENGEMYFEVKIQPVRVQQRRSFRIAV